MPRLPFIKDPLSEGSAFPQHHHRVESQTITGMTKQWQFADIKIAMHTGNDLEKPAEGNL